MSNAVFRIRVPVCMDPDPDPQDGSRSSMIKLSLFQNNIAVPVGTSTRYGMVPVCLEYGAVLGKFV